MRIGDVILYQGEYLLVGDVNVLGGLNNEDAIGLDYEYVGNILEDTSLIYKLRDSKT